MAAWPFGAKMWTAIQFIGRAHLVAKIFEEDGQRLSNTVPRVDDVDSQPHESLDCRVHVLSTWTRQFIAAGSNSGRLLVRVPAVSSTVTIIRERISGTRVVAA